MSSQSVAPTASMTVLRAVASEHVSGVLRKHGAYYIIGTVADLLPVIDEIERRLVAGERP
ncbi:hypothetical protein [Rhizobium freirei]|uniref:hypothetical protein n=1 Tax=Rhizobium freirei TaxID=1353277 RepID=UPI000565226A|nr:hypothetical protein [Rhizobium freirei]